MPPAERGPAARGCRCGMEGAAAALVGKMLMLPVPVEALEALTECQAPAEISSLLLPQSSRFGVLGFVWDMVAVALTVDTTVRGGTVRDWQPALSVAAGLGYAASPQAVLTLLYTGKREKNGTLRHLSTFKGDSVGVSDAASSQSCWLKLLPGVSWDSIPTDSIVAHS